jgi:hypothetical protein
MSCNNSADLRPATYNIQIWKDDNWAQTFALFANDVAINLTGAYCEIQIRPSIKSTTVSATLDSTGGGISIGGVNNNLITVDYPITIAAGNYVYDMTVVFPDDFTKTYIWGTFIVYQDITQI